MRKIILSFLVLVAMVGTMSAQRVWAFGLNLEQSENGELTFTFKATTDATSAYLVFLDEQGEEKGRLEVDNVYQGENEVKLAIDQIPASGSLNWAVELSADPIEDVYEVTDDVDGFYFYLSQGVATNNNPESPHFGKIYVANPVSGKSDGLSEHSQNQAGGIYVFDPLLELENYEEGYTPFNLSLTDGWDAIHRIAVSPIDGTVAFVKWDKEPFTVFSGHPDSLSLDAWWEDPIDLTPTLNQPVAICYDHEGALCVLCFDSKGSTGTIYSIYKMNGTEAESVFTNEGWIISGRSSIASDGRGGYWVVTKPESNENHSGKFMHVTEYGSIDIEVLTSDSLMDFPENFNRAQLAYDLERDILALGGGGKVTLYNVTYDLDGEPSLEKWVETPMFNELKPRWNTDGIAFDYAGDIVVMSASNERFYKYALPTDDNTRLTPAPKSQVIEKYEDGVLDLYVSANQNRKLLHDGQLYIVRNGKLYNALGQQMQ